MDNEGKPSHTGLPVSCLSGFTSKTPIKCPSHGNIKAYRACTAQSKTSNGRLIKSRPVSEERTATGTAASSRRKAMSKEHSRTTANKIGARASSQLASTSSRFQFGKLSRVGKPAGQTVSRGYRRDSSTSGSKDAAVIAVRQCGQSVNPQVYLTPNSTLRLHHH